MRPALLLFTRFPSPGRVKTRLAATVGDELAAGFYRRCVERVLDRVADGVAERIVYVADESEVEAVAQWLGPTIPLRAQCAGDLTHRLVSAVAEALAAGHPSVLVAATDTPDLSEVHVSRAVASLASNEAVLGPASDGGYYLLGMKRLEPTLFHGITWSTDAVAEQTRAALAGVGWTWSELAPLADVDTEADLRAWVRAQSADDPLATWVRASLS